MVARVNHFINGSWRPASDGGTFTSINPADESCLAQVAAGAAADVNAAAAAAKAAFPAWRKTPAPARGEILYRAAQLLSERKEELSRLLTREMGKVISEARGDVQEAIDMAWYMGGEGRRLFGHTAPVEMPDKFGMALREAVGVVGLITPWNFPVAVPSWKLFPALVAGNSVILKPAEDAPATAALFVQICAEAGLPHGVLNLVCGAGETGAALVAHPDVRVISFTGSTDTGLQVYQRAARLGKKVSLEMGGKNAIIVLEDADLDLAAQAVTWSAFGTTGQRCTAASRLIVQREVHGQLAEALTEKARNLVLGDGLDESVDVGPLINEAGLQKVERYMGIAREEGARVLTGGARADLGQGWFFQPTLLDGVTRDMRVAREEIFGPVLGLITVDSMGEAVELNNEVRYGLSSSIFTRDVNRAFHAMRDLSSGIVYINHGTSGAEIQFPFGGIRETGNGMREAGQAGLDTFTEWKTVYVDYSGRLQRAQIDTEALLQDVTGEGDDS
ncbi:MAG: aldehyde dehydrogenase family protein [Anaerolineaceae bacterium]|nr:aldehyde dehydrogenase family protein [Anaerolineaceae bacterium]